VSKLEDIYNKLNSKAITCPLCWNQLDLLYELLFPNGSNGNAIATAAMAM
jgi:hypothetical protein